MEQENKYGFIKIILGCLLLIVIIITVIYAFLHFGKSDQIRYVDGSQEKDASKNVKEEIPTNANTEFYKVSEICDAGKSCNKKYDVQISDNKTANLNYGRTIIEESMTNKIYINDEQVILPERAVIESFGILKSKYYVVSYTIEDDRTFYYLDENLREVKTVSGIDRDTELDSLNYKYYHESEDGSGKKINYEMKITENGTFISNIVE